jgi:hypothetical protein
MMPMALRPYFPTPETAGAIAAGAVASAVTRGDAAFEHTLVLVLVIP